MRSRTSRPSTHAAAPQTTQALSAAGSPATPTIGLAALRPAHQLAGGGLPARGEPAEVEPRGARAGIPLHDVAARGPGLVDERGHAPAMDVVDAERHVAA